MGVASAAPTVCERRVVMNPVVDPMAVVLIGLAGALGVFAGTVALVFVARAMAPKRGRQVALTWSALCVGAFCLFALAMAIVSLGAYPWPILAVPAALLVGWCAAWRTTRAIAP